MPTNTLNLKRGTVIWVNLDPTIGSEVKKTRPAVIISNDAQNSIGKRFIVAPITSNTTKVYPFEASITLQNKESKVMLDQIRIVDIQRIGKIMAHLAFEEMLRIEHALKIVLQIA